jgi:hypothetical protein
MNPAFRIGRPRQGSVNDWSGKANAPVRTSGLANRRSVYQTQRAGGVAEWLNAAVLKTVEPSRAPGVRIPPPPPFCDINALYLMRYLSSKFSLPIHIPILMPWSGPVFGGSRGRLRRPERVRCDVLLKPPGLLLILRGIVQRPSPLDHFDVRTLVAALRANSCFLKIGTVASRGRLDRSRHVR